MKEIIRQEGVKNDEVKVFTNDVLSWVLQEDWELPFIPKGLQSTLIEANASLFWHKGVPIIV